MQYVYVLLTKGKEPYTGCTSNLTERIRLHNAGKVPATRAKRPLKLVYYEAHSDRKDAYARELYFKTGWGRSNLRKILSHALAKNLERV